jgi:hypothetical protein
MSPEEHPRGRPSPPGYPDEGLDLFGPPREPRPRQNQYPPQSLYPPKDQYPSSNQYPSSDQYPPQDRYAPQDQYSQQDGYPQPDRYSRPDQYDPDDYDYQSGDPGRGRGKVIGVLVGLGLIGLLVGVGAAKLLGNNGADQTLVTSASASTAASAPVASATDAPAATAEASPTPSATSAPNYRSIPEDATSEKGLDFGFLTKVTQKNGAVSLRFDRAYFYTGAEATKHNKGVPPDDDYLIENANPELRTFALDPNASIIAANRIANQADGAGREALTVGEFVTNSQAALAADGKLPIWVRHTNGLTGPVTALAEQYLP